MRETKYGLLQEVIDKINQLFSGTDLTEVGGVSVMESLMRHVIENQKIQAEAMANTPVDVGTSPTISIEVEDAIYASATSQGTGAKALLQMEDLRAVVEVLIAMGL